MKMYGFDKPFEHSSSRRLNTCNTNIPGDIWGCIQRFPDWPPGARKNGRAICH